MASNAQTAVRERIVVPARDGRGVRLTTGQSSRVVDLGWSRVGDLFAFKPADVCEKRSAMHMRSVLSRLFPRVGEAFQTNHRRPIPTCVADDAPETTICASSPVTSTGSRGSASPAGTLPTRRTARR